jgi:hypothetical protein
MDYLLTGLSLPPRQVARLVCYIMVFARTSPDQKEFILTWLKNFGFTTMMCGDGTNDVGALKQAHVGVALIGSSEQEEKRREKQEKEASHINGGTTGGDDNEEEDDDDDSSLPDKGLSEAETRRRMLERGRRAYEEREKKARKVKADSNKVMTKGRAKKLNAAAQRRAIEIEDDAVYQLLRIYQLYLTEFLCNSLVRYD